LESLKTYYGYKSELVHPNLISLGARTPNPELKTSVGLEPIFGGFLSHAYGRTVIAVLVKDIITALRILGSVVAEESGKWNEDFEKVKASADELVNALKDSTATAEQSRESEYGDV